MSTIDFQNVIPENLMVPHPTSASKSILRRNLMEVPPNEGSNTYNPLDIIRFDISSNSDFLEGPNSYLKFKLINASGANFLTAVSLEEGGVHCLFRNIEVRSRQSGILLQRIESYNRWAALQSNLYHDRDEVERLGHAYGDSVSPLYHADPYGAQTIGTLTDANLAVDVNGVVTASAGVTRRVQVGDLVRIRSNALPEIEGYVSSIVSDTSFTIAGDDDNLAATALVAHATNQLTIISSGGSVPARRAAFDSTSEYILTMKPLLSILQHTLPLPVMKGGLEIMFELEVGNKALQAHTSFAVAADSANVLSYQIKDPRFMAMMVTPHPDIVKGYMSSWESGGLQYAIPGVVYRRLSRQAAQSGDETVSISIGKRSVKRVYVTQSDSVLLDADAVTARKLRGLSTYLRAKVTKFQFKVGSHSFPNREVICDDYSREAFQQLMMTAGMKGPPRFTQSEWESFGVLPISATTAARDSRKFIMSADLSRVSGSGSDLSGVDLSIVPLDLDFTRSVSHATAAAGGYVALTGTPIMHVFAEHDAFLVISDTQVAVFN